MTRMLVRVGDAAEAAVAAQAGVDVVEVALRGAMPDPSVATAVRQAFPRTLRLTFPGLSLTPDIVAAAQAAGANEIMLAFDRSSLPLPVVDAVVPPGIEIVARVVAGPDNLETVQRVRDRAHAIMLEAEPGRRLIDAVAIAHLDAVASACRSAGLWFGLSGDLEAPDVARLLLLQPNDLGFDTAVRKGHLDTGALDPAALDAMRGLIPRDGAPTTIAPTRVEVTDRIFVRDFVVSLAIGAYKAEHGSRQRVRFSVEADVVRAPVAPRDMRDVFSYDIILETIRVLSERPHVAFVETLAEEVAATLLEHPALSAVSVKVEKLDVIHGSVGIETTRRRPA